MAWCIARKGRAYRDSKTRLRTSFFGQREVEHFAAVNSVHSSADLQFERTIEQEIMNHSEHTRQEISRNVRSRGVDMHSPEPILR